MTSLIRLSLFVAFLAVSAMPAHSRVWSDVTGMYTLEADLIGFDDENVILQRENKELGSCPISKLSEKDREYLKSKEALDQHAETIDQLQTWTTARGEKIVGRIVDFAKESVTIQRRRGKIYVDDTVYKNLPGVYQTLVLGVVQFFENQTMQNESDLKRWVLSLRGEPKTYNLEGVIFELENGDEYGVPFFAFSEEDQQILKPGWEAWLAASGDEEMKDQLDDHAFRLQSRTAKYQQDQEYYQQQQQEQQQQFQQRQVAQMMFNMQAIQSGLTAAWEVTLYPGPGNPYPPRWVVAMGRSSEIAKQNALAQNPGFYAGPVRKVSRRR